MYVLLLLKKKKKATIQNWKKSRFAHRTTVPPKPTKQKQKQKIKKINKKTKNAPQLDTQGQIKKKRGGWVRGKT